MSTFTLKVESAGGNAGNFARISINDTEIGFGDYGRGLNVAVFDQTTGQVLSKANFDTFLPGNAPRFADFINEIPTGQIVALAVKDDAIATLYTEAKDAVVQAFLSIGSTKFGDLQFRGSWALIGQKGGFADATEELSPNSPVTVTRSFSSSSETPPPSSEPEDGKTYYIKDVTTGKYLSVENGSTNRKAYLVMYDNRGSESQQWLLKLSMYGMCIIAKHSYQGVTKVSTGGRAVQDDLRDLGRGSEEQGWHFIQSGSRYTMGTTGSGGGLLSLKDPNKNDLYVYVSTEYAPIECVFEGVT